MVRDDLVMRLVAMGFDEGLSIFALNAVGPDLARATNWLLSAAIREKKHIHRHNQQQRHAFHDAQCECTCATACCSCSAHDAYYFLREKKCYYTQSGSKIRNPKAYARTGAPMYITKYLESTDINAPTCIYKLDLQEGKKYIGKTTNFGRRMQQHFSGNGAMVTKKFKPIRGTVIDEVPGFFSDDVEQFHTEKYIDTHGYRNVRGGFYTNSKTLKCRNTR